MTKQYARLLSNKLNERTVLPSRAKYKLTLNGGENYGELFQVIFCPMHNTE